MLAKAKPALAFQDRVQVGPRDDQAHHLGLARPGGELAAQLGPRIALRTQRLDLGQRVQLLGAPDAAHLVQIDEGLDQAPLVRPILEEASAGQQVRLVPEPVLEQVHGRVAHRLLAVGNRLVARGLDRVRRSRARQREAAPSVHQAGHLGDHTRLAPQVCNVVRPVEERHHFTSTLHGRDAIVAEHVGHPRGDPELAWLRVLELRREDQRIAFALALAHAEALPVRLEDGFAIGAGAREVVPVHGPEVDEALPGIGLAEPLLQRLLPLLPLGLLRLGLLARSRRHGVRRSLNTGRWLARNDSISTSQRSSFKLTVRPETLGARTMDKGA